MKKNNFLFCKSFLLLSGMTVWEPMPLLGTDATKNLGVVWTKKLLINGNKKILLEGEEDEERGCSGGRCTVYGESSGELTGKSVASVPIHQTQFPASSGSAGNSAVPPPFFVGNNNTGSTSSGNSGNSPVPPPPSALMIPPVSGSGGAVPPPFFVGNNNTGSTSSGNSGNSPVPPPPSALMIPPVSGSGGAVPFAASSSTVSTQPSGFFAAMKNFGLTLSGQSTPSDNASNQTPQSNFSRLKNFFNQIFPHKIDLPNLSDWNHPTQEFFDEHMAEIGRDLSFYWETNKAVFMGRLPDDAGGISPDYSNLSSVESQNESAGFEGNNETSGAAAEAIRSMSSTDGTSNSGDSVDGSPDGSLSLNATEEGSGANSVVTLNSFQGDVAEHTPFAENSGGISDVSGETHTLGVETSQDTSSLSMTSGDTTQGSSRHEDSNPIESFADDFSRLEAWAASGNESQSPSEVTPSERDQSAFDDGFLGSNDSLNSSSTDLSDSASSGFTDSNTTGGDISGASGSTAGDTCGGVNEGALTDKSSSCAIL